METSTNGAENVIDLAAYRASITPPQSHMLPKAARLVPLDEGLRVSGNIYELLFVGAEGVEIAALVDDEAVGLFFLDWQEFAQQFSIKK